MDFEELSSDFSDITDRALQVTDEIIRAQHSTSTNTILFVLAVVICFLIFCTYKLSQRYSTLCAHYDAYQVSPIPEELILHIASFSDPNTTVQMSQSCKKWTVLLKENSIWRPFVDQHFPLIEGSKKQKKLVRGKYLYYQYFKNRILGLGDVSFSQEIASWQREYGQVPKVLFALAILVPLGIAFLVALVCHTPDTPIQNMDFHPNCNDLLECIIVVVVSILAVLIFKLIVLFLSGFFERFVEPIFSTFGLYSGEKMNIAIEDRKTTTVVLGAVTLVAMLCMVVGALLLAHFCLVVKIRYNKRWDSRRSKLIKVA